MCPTDCLWRWQTSVTRVTGSTGQLNHITPPHQTLTVGPQSLAVGRPCCKRASPEDSSSWWDWAPIGRTHTHTNSHEHKHTGPMFTLPSNDRQQAAATLLEVSLGSGSNAQGCVTCLSIAVFVSHPRLTPKGPFLYYAVLLLPLNPMCSWHCSAERRESFRV